MKCEAVLRQQRMEKEKQISAPPFFVGDDPARLWGFIENHKKSPPPFKKKKKHEAEVTCRAAAESQLQKERLQRYFLCD